MSINPRSQPYRLDPPVDDKTLPQIVTNADEMFQILFEDIVALDAGIDAAIAAAASSGSVSTTGPKGPPGKDGASSSSSFRVPPGRSNTDFVPYIGAVKDVNLGLHSLTVDSPTFFVDSVNHRVGIGTIIPTSPLQINGSVTAQDIQRIIWSSATVTVGDDFGGLFLQNTNTTNNNNASVYFGTNTTGAASTYCAKVEAIYVNHGAGGCATDMVLGVTNVGAAMQDVIHLYNTRGVSIGFGADPGAASLGVGTSVFTPIIIGGTTTTSTLQIRTTSAVGSPGEAIMFQTGTNGSVQAMSIINSGLVGIGVSNPTPLALYPLSVGAGTGNRVLALLTSSATVAGSVALDFYTQANRGWGSTIVGSSVGTGALDFYVNGAADLVLALTSGKLAGFNIAIPIANVQVKSDSTVTGNQSGLMLSVGQSTRHGGLMFNGNGLSNDTWQRIDYVFSTSDVTFDRSTDGGATWVTWMKSLYANGNIGFGVATPTAYLHVKAGTATASTAPLKFNSGTLLTTAEAGAIEFLTDAYYGTITTGAARKTFAFLESPAFTGTVTGVNFTASGNIVASGAASVIRLKGYTVATLPAAPVQGNMAFVTDSLAPAFNVAIVGGGAVVTPVFYDGTNWIAM